MNYFNFFQFFLNFALLLLNINLINSYTTHYNIKTILHYVDENNKFLFHDRVNRTAWDKNWNDKIGIVALDQCPHIKSILLPKENTFYCALPYNDLDIYGRKANAYSIPWSHYDDPEQKSILKNRWIKVIHKDAFVFCQYEDVGPEFEDDYSYVFGASHSVPESGYGGLAISPEVAEFLGIRRKFKPIKRKMTSYDTSPISIPYEEQSLTSSPSPSTSYNTASSQPKYPNGSDSTIDPDVLAPSSTSSSSQDSINNNSLNTTSTPSNTTPISSNTPTTTLVSTTPLPTTQPKRRLSFNGNSAGDWGDWGEGDDYSPFSSSSVIPITTEPSDGFSSDNDDIRCSWQFVDDKDVPEGPWKKIITTSPSDEVVKSFQNN
ncbi:hypothetical protein DICPUDRAFT_91590 [Dictyostelium purpureum]|uniref:Uncharacterized protein n=1 Tax=Dictyostelium purpureum TaxID=5786 RepID=F0ZEK9_DICPU|nr:uncharacterized protein DICPUDRAFT_91590 [Dictyostelium purpureum]EGC37606.1 hypothetical protein DICPUDRAFT_91590 [Dictyostelium purpureum]|eukprot:XP_003285867.1 hypothetical protein DICPUDRAFT_91590 [Dictyostelium purpureum]